MEPSCLGFLRFLLCCHDEYDDTFHVDFRRLTTLYLSGSQPDLEQPHHSVIHYPPRPPPIVHSRPPQIVYSPLAPQPIVKYPLPPPKIVKSPLPPPQIVKYPLPPPQTVKYPLPPPIVKYPLPPPPIVKSPLPPPQIVKYPLPPPQTVKSLLPPPIVKSPLPPPIVKYPLPPPQIVKSPLPACKTLSGLLSGDEPESSSGKQVWKPKARYAAAVESDGHGLPLYLTPEQIKDLIKRDVVPEVLKRRLCSLTYKNYFSMLLYAEDYYYEKWSEYELEDVTLELREAAVYARSRRRKGVYENKVKDGKMFVAFEIDAIPERRPYLLSRDLVYARRSGTKVEPFQGIICRVVKSNVVLVEFEDDFHSQHYPSQKYDISFSFNRVCLKRAHQALNSVSDSLYKNFLFPNTVSRDSNNATPVLTSNTCIFNREISSAVDKISSVKSSPPYLLVGPRCASEKKSAAYLREPSITGVVIQEAVIQIYLANSDCRILICSPSNSSCDVLMRGLKKSIPESQMFRANAAFREKEDVPDDIIASCLYQKECFSCPPIQRLRSYKVIFSTFVSCYRLHKVGLPVGYFSHIFMVDASFAIEPEALVPLANFADKNTKVVVAGQVGSSPGWVRSKIGRENGLKVSYFERLCECRPYHSLNPSFITHLDTNRGAH